MQLCILVRTEVLYHAALHTSTYRGTVSLHVKCDALTDIQKLVLLFRFHNEGPTKS